MTLVVSEFIESRAVSVNEGRSTATRVFHIYDDAGAQVDPEDIIALYGSSLPGSFEVFPGISGLYRVGVPVLKRAEGGDRTLWVNEHSYSSLSIVPNTNDKLPDEPGYIDVSMEVVAEFTDLWRGWSSVSIPTDGTASDTNTTDIGGNGLDLGGVPGTMLRRMNQITIRAVMEGDPFEIVESANWSSFIGKRNSTTIFGDVKGKVLYEGASMATIRFKVVSVAHRFLADEYFHLQQVPNRHKNGPRVGEPVVDSSNNRVAAVYFRQPYTDFAEFRDMDGLENLP